MNLKRIKDEPKNIAAKIRARQKAGTMIECLDEEGYICYDEEEIINYVPRKSGRKIRKKDV